MQTFSLWCMGAHWDLDAFQCNYRLICRPVSSVTGAVWGQIPSSTAHQLAHKKGESKSLGFLSRLLNPVSSASEFIEHAGINDHLSHFVLCCCLSTRGCCLVTQTWATGASLSPTQQQTCNSEVRTPPPTGKGCDKWRLFIFSLQNVFVSKLCRKKRICLIRIKMSP